MFFKRHKERQKGKRQKAEGPGLSCVATGEAGLNPSGSELSAISYELINYGKIYSKEIDYD